MKKGRSYAALVTSFLALLIVGGHVCAQTRKASSASAPTPIQDPTASISGTLVDSLNQAVLGARITVTNNDQRLERKAETNGEGYFYIPFLPIGTYTMLIEMAGFATIRVSGLVLHSGMNSVVSLTLQPRGAKEVIDVKATQSSIDASSATIRYSVPAREIEAFPIIASSSGRSILDSLPLYLPGVLPYFNVGIRGEGLVVNGARPLSNSFSIEGGDNNDYELNRAASPYPNPDVLQELTVLTNNYKADSGGAAGVVEDATVKGGTNHFHGNLRYFMQDAALGARSFFQEDKYPFRLSSVGGQIGGPVAIPHFYNGRDRTHFFFDAEDNYISQGSQYTRTTLSIAERNGNFSKLPPYDPSNPNSQPLDPRTGKPFPGAIIPPDRLDPIAVYYLNHVIPVPDNRAGTYLFHYRDILWNKQYTARLDQILGSRDSLTGVIFANRNDYVEASSGGHLSQRYEHIAHSLSAIGHETHSLSALSLNQVTATFVRSPEGTAIDQPGATGIPPGQVGFTGIRPQNPAIIALPLVALTNVLRSPNSISYDPFFSAGASPSGGTTKMVVAVKDELIRATGRHTFKAGAGTRFFLLDRLDDDFYHSRNGVFGFENDNPNGTGNTVADFLLGLPAGYSQSSGITQRGRQWSYSFYVMDDWRLRQTLTLNLGVRYELTPPLVDEHNHAMVFRPGAQSSLLPNAPKGLLFPGDSDPVLGTVPRAGYRTSWTDFAPRLGLAYSPYARSGLARALLGSGKSAIRAGFGVFYNPTYGFDASKPSQTPPFNDLLSITVDKHGSFANPFGRQMSPFPVSPDQAVFFSNATVYAFDPHFRTAYTFQYNVSIQRELGHWVLLELSYIGSSSYRLDREFDDNPYVLNPSVNVLYPMPTFPDFGCICVQRSDGRARYDSFQARVSRKFRSGLILDASYVFGKSLDDSSGPSIDRSGDYFYSPDRAGFSDPYTWARSGFDRRQNFTAFYAYDLPAFDGRGAAALLLNGWQIGGITQLRSGMPMDITGNGSNGRPDIIGPFQRFDPRHVRTFVIDGIPITGNFLFDPTVFRAIPFDRPQVRAGNLGRNVFSAPGLNLTSLSIVKRNKIRESQQLEFRADITNAFNHANFNSVNTALGTSLVYEVIGFKLVPASTFGQVYGALPGRALQLSVRYRF